MNHNVEAVTVNFALDEIIMHYGTSFRGEMGFVSSPSSPDLLKVYCRKSGRNVKLTAHLHVLPWLKMRGTLPPLPFTSLWLDVEAELQLSSYLSVVYSLGFSQLFLEEGVKTTFIKYVIFSIFAEYDNHTAIKYIRGLLFSCINLLKPAGHVVHQQFNIQQLYVLPTLYLCVLYLSENKQRLVPLTA